MINKDMHAFGSAPSAMRALFAYGLERKALVGEDNVYDYSIGNPSVPAAQEITDTLNDLLKEPPEVLHGYTPSAGAPSVREAIAQDIRNRFDFPATAGKVYMTVGAAAALSISIAAITHPGDEVMVVAPYFPEYRVWIERAGCACVEVLADSDTFQIDTAAVEAAITEKTSAIIVNSPNNPVGVVYSEETLKALAEVLRRKSDEIGKPIYLICDEPYRQIVFGGLEVPFVPFIYERTIVCYSYSKAFSLPGERIGYVYVSDTMEDADEVFLAVSGAGRALGFVCAPVLFQRLLERCAGLSSDVASYEKNRQLLMQVLDEAGFDYILPQGAFYLWMRSPIPDAKELSEIAKKWDLLIVPSDSFGVTGWIRLGYCISAKTIVDSAQAFKNLRAYVDEHYPDCR